MTGGRFQNVDCSLERPRPDWRTGTSSPIWLDLETELIANDQIVWSVMMGLTFQKNLEWGVWSDFRLVSTPTCQGGGILTPRRQKLVHSELFHTLLCVSLGNGLGPWVWEEWEGPCSPWRKVISETLDKASNFLRLNFLNFTMIYYQYLLIGLLRGFQVQRQESTWHWVRQHSY